MDELMVEGQDATLEETSTAVEETSVEYLGRWNRLVSTTNWEKGRIISEWRRNLMEADAPTTAYSDEAWSRRVGNVSPQHVGRLRRVFDQFGEVQEDYAGLYWSHFQAALDWNDAEMWLEGAVQSGWSVAQMRAQRWEAMGAPADKKPRDEDVITAERDEDVAPLGDDDTDTGPLGESPAVVHDPEAGPDVPEESSAAEPADDSEAAASEAPTPEPVRPFEKVGELPDDLAEALEAMKLAILHHKGAGWKEVSRDNVLMALEGLEQLAVAPAEG